MYRLDVPVTIDVNTLEIEKIELKNKSNVVDKNVKSTHKFTDEGKSNNMTGGTGGQSVGTLSLPERQKQISKFAIGSNTNSPAASPTASTPRGSGDILISGFDDDVTYTGVTTALPFKFGNSEHNHGNSDEITIHES